jgi:hypothetical protein
VHDGVDDVASPLLPLLVELFEAERPAAFLNPLRGVVKLAQEGSRFSRPTRRHVLRGGHLLLHTPESPAAAVTRIPQDAVHGTFPLGVEGHRIVYCPRTVCDVDHAHVRIEDLQAFVGRRTGDADVQDREVEV